MNRLFITCMLVTLAMTAAARSETDSITLRGTEIAMACTIDRIESGRLFYADLTGRARRLPLEDVQFLSFAGNEALDEANALLAQADVRGALTVLMRALLAAETDTQKLWIRSLLVSTHSALGEYVQAAGHVAAITLIEPHNHWQRIKPLGRVNDAPFAATSEAMAHLRAAAREVSHPQLRIMINELIQNVEPVHRAAADGYDGPSIEPGSTISGIAISAISSGDFVSEAEPPRQQQSPRESDQQQPEVHPEQPPVEQSGIAALLQQQRYEQAVAECERIARNPGRRDLPEFLHSYGLALRGMDRHEDAAVMFMRGAILFPGSRRASESLIEAAEIYRDVYRRHDTALRLLDLAAAEDAGHDRPEIERRIADVRSTLHRSGASPRTEPPQPD